MAKKNDPSSSGSRSAPRGERAAASRSGGGAPASSSGAAGDTEADGALAADELEELESRLNARLGGERGEAEAVESAVAAEEAPSQSGDKGAPRAETVEASVGKRESGKRELGQREAGQKSRFGPVEWAALGGFAAIALAAGLLFFKFLYAHPAPLQGKGLPSSFSLPLAGPAVRLSGAQAGWRERAESDTARAEETILPEVVLTLDAAHASKGFVRVEFVDSEGKVRGDILTVGIEGGRFQVGDRAGVAEDGGLKVRLAGTVGFRSRPLFTSYLVGDEPRWSVRLKEGPDSSNGPWTDLGAALIPNNQH